MLTDGKQHIEASRTAQDLEPEGSEAFTAPFVFSQSEIESIGLQSQSRLRLVDGFLPLEYRQAVDSVGAARIRSATTEIRTLLTEIDDFAEKTRELPKLQAQLETIKAQSAVQGQVHKEIEGHRKALAEVTPLLAAARVRSETIGRAADQLVAWTDKLDELLERKPGIEPWPIQTGTADELADLRKREKQAAMRLRTGLEEMQAVASALERMKLAAASQRTGLENRARDIRQKIEERQKGASAIEKRISDLTQQISVLKSLIDLRKDRETRVKRLTDQRAKLLAQQDAADHPQSYRSWINLRIIWITHLWSGLLSRRSSHVQRALSPSSQRTTRTYLSWEMLHRSFIWIRTAAVASSDRRGL
jgi:DNA repair exonuclease SbcCD ATPase subunit